MPTIRCTCGRNVPVEANAETALCPVCEQVLHPRRCHEPKRGDGADILCAAPGHDDVVDVRFPAPFWMLGALLLVLLPAWVRQEMECFRIDGAMIPDPVLTLWQAVLTVWQAIGPVLRAMFDPWLAAAVALLLSLRAGVVNFSVWAHAAVGAVIFWMFAGWGLPLPLAAAVAVGTASVLGLAQGQLARERRLRASLITLVSAAVLMVLCRIIGATLSPVSVDVLGQACRDDYRVILGILLFGVGFGALGAGRWGLQWLIECGLGVGLIVAALAVYGRFKVGVYDYSGLLRIVILVVLYAFMVWRNRRRGVKRSPVWASPPVVWALTIAAALAAGGGCVMLLARSSYHPGAWLFGDLRPAAAVVLCGGWRWRGWQGAVFMCLLLPVMMLISTMWMQMIGAWLPGLHGVWPLVLLMVLAGGTHLVGSGRGYRRLRRSAVAATALGTVIVALGAYWPAHFASIHLAVAGMIVWLVGLGLGLVRLHRLRHDRSARLAA